MGEAVTVDAKCQYSHPGRRMAAVLWEKNSTRFTPAAAVVAAADVRVLNNGAAPMGIYCQYLLYKLYTFPEDPPLSHSLIGRVERRRRRMVRSGVSSLVRIAAGAILCGRNFDPCSDMRTRQLEAREKIQAKTHT